MVEFGVYNVGGNPNLTFILFIGLAILLALGVRFAYYAHRNRAASAIETQTPIWSALLAVGVLAAVYGSAGLLEIVSSLRLPYRSGALLGMTLAIAFAIRRIHAATSAVGGETGTLERAVRAALVGLVLAHVGTVVWLGESTLAAATEGISALSFVAYGLVFYRAQTAGTRLQGTMLDSLLRHLVPVLTFGALVSTVSLATAIGLDRVVVQHIQAVFIIMTATALMSGTIKLRQNLAAL